MGAVRGAADGEGGMRPCGLATTYWRGCRCADCRKAATAYARERYVPASQRVEGPSRPCASCGNHVEGRRSDAIYCTESCQRRTCARRRNLRPRASERCLRCGVPMLGRMASADYCSKACGVAGWRAEHPEASMRWAKRTDDQRVRYNANNRARRWGPELAPLAEAVYQLKKEAASRGA